MVELGVFARVFPPGRPAEVAAAIRAAGFTTTQLNLIALGLPSLDRTLTDDDAAAIRRAFAEAGVGIWALSATFNAIDPDHDRRRAGVVAARHLIARAPALGASVVTLCTGTRDPRDMWRAHPDNGTRAAWADLLRTLDPLLAAARQAGVRLGIEPEAGNVVSDADRAVELLEFFGDDARHLGIVLDPANLLTVATLPQQERILGDAFEVLGPSVVGLHAKDVVASGYAAAGSGGLDYGVVARGWAGLPAPVPVIAQDLRPDDARRVHDLLAAHFGGDG